MTNGTTPTTFSPNVTCTRVQAVTFIWRAAGSPELTSTTMQFADVADSACYYKAVLWTIEKGVTVGTGPTTFSPSETCTRAQIVTMLYRNAASPATDGDTVFTDVQPDAYYYNAVL